MQAHTSTPVETYIAAVTTEGDRFATAAEQGPLDVPIAACEGWDMRALVRHLGLIHLWAAGNVAYPSDDWLDADDIPDMARYWPELGAAWPTDDELVAWYRRTLENLVRVLESAPADHECFSFLPAPTPVMMWARRQASEIAIHRVDAEEARGLPSTFESGFAADMLDELLTGFAPRPRAAPADIGTTQVLHVDAHDVDQHWYLTITDDGISTSRDGSEHHRTEHHRTEHHGSRADLTVTATADELYRLMWHRAPASIAALDGDPSVMDAWRATCRVRWSGGE